MAEEVVERPERQRFEMAVDGELALAYYRVENGRLVLTHTEVPQRLSGRGVGSALAKGVFEALRASGRKAALACDFMGAYAARHPEVQDVVAG
jgi:predicted GNAT family acetyltransferase